MLEKSGFTNKTIISTILKKYNIKVTKIEKLNRGSANIYLLNDKYILKEFQSKYTKKEIMKEIKVINHLRKDKLPVPEYIQTVSKRYCFTYKGKVVVMQKYIEGYTIENNEGNFEQTIESATYLGKIAASLETLKLDLPSNDVTSWVKEEKIDKAINKHKDLLNMLNGEYKSQIEKDLKDKLNMLEGIKKIDFSGLDKLTIMNTHGDYSLLQFIYENGKIKSIIDFAAACRMPIVWEVIRSFSYIDPKSKDGNLDFDDLVAYVKEFNKYVKLNEYDIKYMSFIYLIQILISDYGYKQYLNDNSKVDLLKFGFYRTNLCRFLYDNAQKISDLLKDAIK